jgi:hypothetical protein
MFGGMNIFHKMILLFVFFASCSENREKKSFATIGAMNKLSGDTIQIEVHYAGFSCPCAQWGLENDSSKEFIYLERANVSLPIADTLWDGVTLPFILRAEGQFYLNKAFPKDLSEKAALDDSARVFRFDKIEIATK